MQFSGRVLAWQFPLVRLWFDENHQIQCVLHRVHLLQACFDTGPNWLADAQKLLKKLMGSGSARMEGMD